jgi:hypothetical protein
MAALEDYSGVLEQTRKLVEKNKRLPQLTPVDNDLANALDDYTKYVQEDCIDTAYGSAGPWRKSHERLNIAPDASRGRMPKATLCSRSLQRHKRRP